MANDQVKREVTIELNVVASNKNAAVAQAVASQVEQANKSQVNSEKTALDQLEARHLANERFRKELHAKIENAQRETLEKIEAAEKKAAEQTKKTLEAKLDLAEKLHEKDVQAAKRADLEKIASAKAAYEEMAARAEETALRSAESAMNASAAALKGAMKVAQGMATLGIVSNDNLEEVVRSLVKIQGLFNALNGSITVIQSLNQAMIAWKATTTAQTAANVALAASQAAVNSTAAGGAVGGVAAGGMSVGAKVAGGGALAVGAKAVAGSAAGAAAAGGKTAAILGIADVVQASVTKVANSLGLTSREAETLTGALIGWRKAAKDAAESTSKLEAAEENRRKRLAQQQADNEKISQQTQFQAQVRAERSGIAGRIEGALNSDETAQAELARLRALSEIEQAEAEIAAARERAIARQQRGEFALIEDKLQAEERFKTAIEQRANAEQRVFDLTKSRLEVQKSIVEQAKTELEAAKQAAESEEQRVQNKLAGFAKLGRGEQERIREAAQRFQEGGIDSLTRADIDLLERTGQGGGVVEKFRAREGADAGGEDVFRAFGELEGRDAAIRRRDELTASLAEKQSEQLRIDEELAKAKRRYVDALLKQSEALERASESQGQQLGIEGPISGSPAAMQAAFGEIRQVIIDSIRGVAQDVRRSQESAAAMRE